MDVALALIDEHDVVVHDLGFHAVAGNPHEHHVPGIALAVQEIAPESIAALRIAADLEAAVPGGQACLHHRDHDQIHVARGHRLGKLRLRKGPRRFIKAGKGASWRTLPCPVKIQFGETLI